MDTRGCTVGSGVRRKEREFHPKRHNVISSPAQARRARGGKRIMGRW